jgi:hypothetical protein
LTRIRKGLLYDGFTMAMNRLRVRDFHEMLASEGRAIAAHIAETATGVDPIIDAEMIELPPQVVRDM